MKQCYFTFDAEFESAIRAQNKNSLAFYVTKVYKYDRLEGKLKTISEVE